MITLNLDLIQADLLRCALDNQIEELKFSDCDDDAIDMYRLVEIRNSIDQEMKKNLEM